MREAEHIVQPSTLDADIYVSRFDISGTASDTFAPRWPLAGRVAFRFFFCYILLYFDLPGLLTMAIPGLNGLYTQFWDNAVPVAVGRALFHVAVSNEVSGSGDMAYQWIQTGCELALAAAITLIWSVLDRKRANYTRLYDYLRIYVRFMLFWNLFQYGAMKLLPVQFGALRPDALGQPVGEMRPMRLLWTFMSASQPYQFFGGAMETVCALLLTTRRTTTLGALLACATMSNVVMLNFCYDVPVKLFSTHLLLFSAFLLAPDVRRLADFLVLGKPAQLEQHHRVFQSPRWNAAALVARTLLVAGCCTFLFFGAWQDYHANASSSDNPLVGHWIVDSYSELADAHPAPVPWGALDVSAIGIARILQTNGRSIALQCRVSPGSHAVVIVRQRGLPSKYVLAYTAQPAGEMALDGLHDGRPVHIRLHLDNAAMVLTHTPFHWISPKPNNH